MPLRIGFDMDGVIADFSLAFHDVEKRLFGVGPVVSAGQPETEEENQSSDDAEELEERGQKPEKAADQGGDKTAKKRARELRLRRDAIWRAIQSTPNFWSTLEPIEEGAVRRIHALMLQHRWEVFFITQRPKTEGDTVQRQTQHWLVEQGFDLPSVLVLGGSRGAAAAALRLNYHIDDSAQNCLDVIADSRANPILIVPDNAETTIASARKLGIGTARSLSECLDILDRATSARTLPTLLRRIAELVGWRSGSTDAVKLPHVSNLVPDMRSVPPTIPRRVNGMILPPFDGLTVKAAKLRADGHDVISLGQAVPGFGPPPAAIEAARHALSNPETHLYSADAGLLSLRAALCAALHTYHSVHAIPDELIITAGGNQAFMLAAMTLVDPGDEVILPSPYFVNHEMTLRAIGAMPIEAPLQEAQGFRTRWSDIEPYLTKHTRAVVLCTPGNPTGAVIDGPELKRIVLELATRGIVLICDETYRHFVYDGAEGTARSAECPSAAAVSNRRENVVVIGTFSKSFGMTGWRVGYMLAGRGICDQALKIQDAMIICAPVISQIAAEAAVRESWNYAHEFDAELRVRRQILADGLERIARLHWTRTSGAFFAFVRVDGCRDSATLAADILERAHVVTIPGAAFGRSGEGYLRLSYGAATREELTEACERLRGFFAEGRRS